MACKRPGPSSSAKPAMKHERTAIMLETKLVRDAVPQAAPTILVTRLFCCDSFL